MIALETGFPDIRLTPYVKMYFWGSDEDAPRVQRTVPNGEMGLCFYRNSNVIYDGQGNISSCLSGQRTVYQDIISDGRLEIVFVGFTTLGAHMFFNTSLYEFFGKNISLSELGDQDLLDLEQRVMLATSTSEIWSLLDEFFLQRLSQSKADPINFKRLWRAISYGQRHLADARVSDLASEACLSERHLSRVFSDITGMSPKDYMRVQRYHNTLKELKAMKVGETISDIAWRNGYCDFSHLSAEFRKISGYSPSTLIGVSDNDSDEIGWRI